MEVLITICARGGSKGIPGKNIKMLAGKPLIAYTIKVAKNISAHYNATIAISTDDEQIKNVCKQLGLNTHYKRPASLATDSAGKIDTIKDLLLFEENIAQKTFDYILDLDVTSPLRNSRDIKNAFQTIQQNNQALTLFSVNNASRNPYFNMVEQADDGFFKTSKKLDTTTFTTRQSAPKVYELNASFYWYKREFFNQNHNSPITNQSLIYIMPHVCFDLDHPIDFDFLEFLIVQNKLNFDIE